MKPLKTIAWRRRMHLRQSADLYARLFAMTAAPYRRLADLDRPLSTSNNNPGKQD